MKRPILLILTLAFFYITLSSYSGGLATQGINRTGAGGSAANCAGSGCHPANSSDLSISIIIIDPANGDTLTNPKYQIGKAYTIVLFGSYSSGGLPKFGFQFTATRANGQGAGDLIATSSGIQNVVVAPYQIMEHSHPLDASGSVNQHYVTYFTWYPTAAYGDVTFYATMLASNDDGFVNGDITNNQTRTIQQVATSVPSLASEIKTSIYPNPASDMLNLAISNAPNGACKADIFNIHGQRIESKTLQVAEGKLQTSFSTSGWAAGTYLLHISHGTGQRVLSFIKQ